MSAVTYTTRAPHLDKPIEAADILGDKMPKPPPRNSVSITFAAPQIVGPTLPELAANFTEAMGKWAAKGFKTVSLDVYENRLAICGKCSFWDKDGWLGYGKCNAPKCGCTRFKLWLATETCKHPDGSRWPENLANPSPSVQKPSTPSQHGL